MKKVSIFLLFIFILYTCNPGVYAIHADNKKIGDWSSPEVVSTESTGNAYRAMLAVDQNGTIHIAWKDESIYQNLGTNWHIFYKYKPKGGNWTDTEMVSTESTGYCNCLSMVVDQNATVHVVWKDNSNYKNIGTNWHIFYKNKPKGGNWTTTEIVSTESTGDCGCPSLAVDKNNTIHVTWADDSTIFDNNSDWDIFYRSRLKNGYWTEYELVSNDSSTDSLEPSIDVDSENYVHIAWSEITDIGNNSRYCILYKEKDHNGTWLQTEYVSTESTRDSVSPKIKADNNIIHIVWADNSDYDNPGNNFDVFYKNRSINGTWSRTEVVSKESTSDISFPTLAVDSNNTLHVAWTQRLGSGSSSQDKIYYSQKKMGESWSEYEIASNKIGSDAQFPFIFVDSTDKVHLSWEIIESVPNENYDCPSCDETYIDRWTVVYNYRIPVTNASDNNETRNNGNQSDNQKSDRTPGFEITLSILSIASFLFFNQWRRKSGRKP